MTAGQAGSAPRLAQRWSERLLSCLPYVSLLGVVSLVVNLMLSFEEPHSAMLLGAAVLISAAPVGMLVHLAGSSELTSREKHKWLGLASRKGQPSGAQDRYERLADEIRRLLDEEAPFLADAVYTVKYRLKGHARLIQKIEQANGRLRKGQPPISVANFQERIEDLLGVRVVCLRLSDLAKIQAHLKDLEEDSKLKILKGPIEKKTFLITPGDPDAAKDLQYSGYSSVHYVLRLGKASRPSEQIAPLKAEVQLRTILEEAWGEIDHKYRYELKRGGKRVPAHVDAGFRDLALYLQAAARHVEHLCEDIEHLVSEPRKPARKTKKVAVPVPAPAAAVAVAVPSAPPAVPLHPLFHVFKALVGVEPTPRALPYLLQRLRDHSLNTGQPFTAVDLERALDSDLLKRFGEIYKEVMGKAPFQDRESSDRDLDIIPLVNFAIFNTVQSKEPAEAGLRASLRRRLLQRSR